MRANEIPRKCENCQYGDQFKWNRDNSVHSVYCQPAIPPWMTHNIPVHITISPAWRVPNTMAENCRAFRGRS